MYGTHTTYYESHRFNYAWAQINNLRLLPLFLCYDSGVFTPISKEDPFILHIRPVNHTDADMLFTFFEQLDRETNFLLFETGERILSRQQLEIRLQQILEGDSECMWVVTGEQRISGHLGLRRGNVRRNRHAAIIAMGLLQSCCGQGWGAKLLQHAESWARGHQIHRLGLTVMPHNERALRLYQKQGFVIEGLQKDSLLVNGTYVDMTSKSR